MGKRDPRVDIYIEKAADFAKPVLIHLREVIHATCADVEEDWKWSFPVFIYKGAIMCNMAAFKQHCAFGFWKASLMQDPEGVLEVKDRDGMGHIGRITALSDLPKDAILKKYIKEAMKLTDDGIKLPPRKKASEKEKSELVVPDYFLKELKKNEAALKVFNDFSYSNKKEYVEWFEDAKTETTRNKRIAEGLGWIAEGKTRLWKYKN